MSATVEQFLVIAAVILVGLPASLVLVRRARRHDSVRDRIIRASLLDPTAAREVDDLELLFSLPDYDRAAASVDDGLTDLFEQLGPPPAYDPAWEPGLERLWDAIRDEQQKGEL